MKRDQNFLLHSSDAEQRGTRIKVIGVGGGGSTADDHLSSELTDGVEFYVANTDAQALGLAKTPNKLQFGIHTTRGHGAGFDPEKGRQAALEDRNAVTEYLSDAEMVFITAGLGGGTGTGAAPVFAKAVKESNPHALVIAIVTTPFSFEGKRRIEYAEDGIKALHRTVDSMIAIPNDKILTGDVPLHNAYGTANDVLLNAVRGIADVIAHAGFINVDFADVQTIMLEKGTTIMGHGRACGEQRAINATFDALHNPLLADVDISLARGILVNVTASPDISTNEYREIGELIHEAAGQAKSIISGLIFDEGLGDEIRVTIIASGLQTEQSDVFSTRRVKLYDEFPPFEESQVSDVHPDETADGAEDDEQEATTETFGDGPAIYDYESNTFPESEEGESEYIPSILRNRKHFRPGPYLNGSVEA